MKKDTNDISEMIAPIFTIAMQINLSIGKLLKKKFNISIADFKILRAVHVLKVCSQSDIALFNNVTETAVSKRIGSLIGSGLVKKNLNLDDRRKFVLTLTSKGKAQVMKMQTMVTNKMKMVFNNFEKKDRKLLKELLTKLLRMLTDDNSVLRSLAE